MLMPIYAGQAKCVYVVGQTGRTTDGGARAGRHHTWRGAMMMPTALASFFLAARRVL